VSTPPNSNPAPPASGPASSPESHGQPKRPGQRRWPWVVGGLLLAIVLFVALFDWNLLRGPAERFASRSTGREVTIGHFDVQLRRWTPSVVLTDVTLGNPEWAGPGPMGRARALVFSVRLPTLLTNEIVIPHLRLADAEVTFQRDAEGRANWRFREKDEPGRRNVNVLTLGLDDARVGYRDAMIDLTADLHGSSHRDGPYETKLTFAGKWRGDPFEGAADTGSVLSLRGSDQPFPMRINGKAGRTSIQAEGEVADITRFRHIDADFAISGPSLASLYQTLRIALPETPPYQARGRLKRENDIYSYENFRGRIGGSDIAGSARYELREPRPLLNADLQSKKLNLADLGPLVGLNTGGSGDAPAADARRRNAKDAKDPKANASAPGKADDRAQATAGNGGRLFPDDDFNLEKLNAMDADVRLTAARLGIPDQVPLEDFATRAYLQDGVLTLDPLNFGFAGGDIVGKIVLDARKDPLAGNASIDFKQVKLAQLFPAVDRVNQSGGSVGAQVRLAGRGNSVADLLGSSNGTVAAGMAGGRVSELAVWLVNLHGGELLPLLFGGDRPTPIRCGAAALDVKNGVGTVSTFLFDTEESTIRGSGTVDFRNERLDIRLLPEPKKPGLLSIRGPIHLQGGFRDVDFKVDPQSIARGIGAIALGIVSPILALIPLIETGPGEDTNCRQVLAPVKGAVEQSGKSVDDAPAAGESTRDREPAPIVNVPPGGKGAPADTRQPQAPIQEVAPARKNQSTVERQPQAPIQEVPPAKNQSTGERQPQAPIVDVPAKK
jgi:AsmA family protein